jgi:heterodisulfide reductase subunit A
LRIAADAHGFFQELHPKLRPVETLTAGIYLAGAAQGPKDIPEAVCQASAAASKTMELLSQPMLHREPTTAEVNDANCVGCFECLQVCPYGAIEQAEIGGRKHERVRYVARVNPAVCEGCGVCTVTCRGGNIDLQGCTDEQIFAQMGALGPIPESVEKEESTDDDQALDRTA